MRFRVVVEAQFDEEGTLSNVCGDTLKLEGLETCPTEEIGVGGGKFAKVLGKVLVCEARANCLLLRIRHLSCGVLADGFM